MYEDADVIGWACRPGRGCTGVFSVLPQVFFFEGWWKSLLQCFCEGRARWRLPVLLNVRVSPVVGVTLLLWTRPHYGCGGVLVLGCGFMQVPCFLGVVSPLCAGMLRAYARFLAVDEQVRDWLEAGVITHGEAKWGWSSPLLSVPRRDKPRTCLGARLVDNVCLGRDGVCGHSMLGCAPLSWLCVDLGQASPGRLFEFGQVDRFAYAVADAAYEVGGCCVLVLLDLRAGRVFRCPLLSLSLTALAVA